MTEEDIATRAPENDASEDAHASSATEPHSAGVCV